jgi:IS30 family transposase
MLTQATVSARIESWERGVNENTYGLIRQYFPKKTNLREVTSEQVDLMVNKLNNRPRKCLEYRTPNEVFYGLDVQTLKSPQVALRN